jgi:hypothetical protein
MVWDRHFFFQQELEILLSQNISVEKVEDLH